MADGVSKPKYIGNNHSNNKTHLSFHQWVWFELSFVQITPKISPIGLDLFEKKLDNNGTE